MAKKNIYPLSILFIVVVALLIWGCNKNQQKPQVENTDLTNVEFSPVGRQKIEGIISRSHSIRMSEAFAERFPNVSTKYVGYSTKNLLAYLNQLLENKIDSVFVGYGVYDQWTAPKASYIGRSTIFFMGNKNISNRSNIKIQSASDSTNNQDLNSGSMFP